MHKLIATTLFLSTVFLNNVAAASTTVNPQIPANSSIAPNSAVAIPMTGLASNVPYQVNCQVDVDTNTTSDLAFSYKPDLASHGGFGVPSVNGQSISTNIVHVNSGKNTFSFMVSVADSANAANNMTFKNLDDHNAMRILSCQAAPVANVNAAGSNSAKHGVVGGYFYVTNNLSYYLDINVGNYVPTPYCIPPYYREYISVSTSNQDIEVTNFHN